MDNSYPTDFEKYLRDWLPFATPSGMVYTVKAVLSLQGACLFFDVLKGGFIEGGAYLKNQDQGYINLFLK